MKKFSFLFLTTVFLMAAMPFQTAANQDIKVIVNGSEVLFTDQKPVIQDGRTLVPVRGVFEQMGFSVIWDETINTATLKDADYEVKIKSEEISFMSNGNQITPDVSQQLINGRLMLPLRAISDSVGAQVDWDGAARVVTVNYGKKSDYNEYCTGIMPDGTTLAIFESKDSVISKLGQPDRIGDKWEAYDRHSGAQTDELIMTVEEWSALPDTERASARVYDAKDGFSVLYYTKLGPEGFLVLNGKNQIEVISVSLEGFKYLDLTVGNDYPVESSFRPLAVDYDGVYERFVRPSLSDMPMLYIDYRTDSDKIGGIITAIIQPPSIPDARPADQKIHRISIGYKAD